MNNTLGSSVHALGSSAYVRPLDAAAKSAASLAVLFVLASPFISHAGVIFQSAATGTNEVELSTPTAAHGYFNGTADYPTVDLGTWSMADFTPDASTTLQLWARWNGVHESTLDVIVRATVGGDPFYGAGSTTAQVSLVPYNDSYYRLAVDNTTTTQAYIIPATPGQTIHKGDDLWAYLYPSWIGYGADHWLLASGTVPFVQLCEGDCAQSTNTPPCLQDCDPNILFIPGIEGSRLYDSAFGKEVQLWEPDPLSFQSDAEALYLNPDGTSIHPIYTKANGTIDTVGIPLLDQTDIYKPLLDQLEALKASGTIADYLAFPYDWRMSPEDVVNNGTPYDDGTHYLDQALIALASTSKNGKVTIVAHSNGGLVAKALMLKLQQEGKAGLVDKIILVDVPQTGTPASIAALLHGDGESIGLLGTVVSQATARGLGENMPDAYGLLPSPAYFAKVATPVLDLSQAPALRASSGVGPTISDAATLAKFLTTGRAKPAPSDIQTPDLLSSQLLGTASLLHADLDAWMPPPGVQVVQVAGWGIDTVAGVSYAEVPTAHCILAACTFSTTTEHTLNFTDEGDSTVVVPSEAANASWPTYFINVAKYDSDTASNYGHANIMGAQPFQSLLPLLLASTSIQSLPAYVTTTEPPSSSLGKTLRLRVDGSATFDAYDAQGRHTGLVPNTALNEDDSVQNDIPGSYYERSGEEQYIGLPASGTYKIVLHGTDTGTFTAQLTPVASGIAATSTTFNDIPVGTTSVATLNVTGSQPASSTLALDEDGDGKIDVTIASSSQTTDPLGYATIIKTSIAAMNIGAPVQKQLQAKLINTIYLIEKLDLWDSDDDDARDTVKTDKVAARVTKKLGKIEAYVQKEIGKPISKRDKDERITNEQGAAILDMIEELQGLVNSKLTS